MKSKYFLPFFLLITIHCFSQNLESLKTQTQKLYEANYLMDFDAIVALSYPKMVNTIGKDSLIAKIDYHYENKEYRLRLQLETLPFQYGTIKKIADKSYCVITFRNPIRYFFETKLTTETAAEKKVWLQQINKTKDVTFEPNRNSFNVRKTSTYVAVMDESTNYEWKFFNFDYENQRIAFKTIFDETTLKLLGI